MLFFQGKKDVPDLSRNYINCVLFLTKGIKTLNWSQSANRYDPLTSFESPLRHLLPGTFFSIHQDAGTINSSGEPGTEKEK